MTRALLTLLLTASLSTALAAGPRSALVDATFIDGAQMVNGAPELAEFAGALRTVATKAGGSCVKSEYVVWDSVDGLEASFRQVLGSLGYSWTELGASNDDGRFVSFKATKGAAALAGIWADSEGTTLLGWCSLKLTAAAKPPAALTPAAPAAPAPRPATPAPAPAATRTPAPAAPAPTVKPPAPKKGYVTGLVLDTQGRPLAGAEVYIVGTTFNQGQRTSFTAVTKGDGTYAIRVPDGRYHASATVKRDLAGTTFVLPLHPESGTLNTEIDSSEGGNLNFRWRLAGAKPGGGKDWDDFYGASLDFSYCGLPAKAYCDDRYAAVVPGAPEGSTVTLTFTPQGKLIDGSAGKPVVMTFKTAPLAPPGGYPYTDPNGGGRTTLGQGWPYHSFDFNDIPLGVYTLTAVATTPDGRKLPLKLGLEPNNVEANSVTLKWSSYDVSGALKQFKVYVRD
ncbi:carboxypeptidase-like regulatory domain-containing protein [Deinococcus aquaedulcis]|uniref:carboxypeptidase-like regulatory domain-containing protein n=1 Tax=Deinococcus aquaedulcis TaxID=2840455 RepID=UPI001C82E18F|nr:carboxypeptidase-like regulatory domain-containing protein [Deinococcus aquaedulcis]